MGGWYIALDASIVLRCWSNITVILSMEGPRGSRSRFVVDDDLDALREEWSTIEVMGAEEISLGRQFWVEFCGFKKDECYLCLWN